jgi:hypothetical protein
MTVGDSIYQFYGIKAIERKKIEEAQEATSKAKAL